MKLLVTGSNGFIGKNLIAELKNRGYEDSDIYRYDRDTDEAQLDEYVKDCGFVFHLAGVNRPKDVNEFMEGNFGFTSSLLDKLKKNGNKAPVLITSSIQADQNNPYGESKKAGEELLFSYSDKTGARVIVYRLENVFGKWCRPNYNSVVATFCNNIAADLPIVVNDPNVVMKLVYIDDVVDEFIKAIDGGENLIGKYACIPTVHTVLLGKIAQMLQGFKESRNSLDTPNMSDEFEKKLYSTYLSYLPEDDFSYKLNMHVDDRGSFTEFIRTRQSGQVSINISKPGITKGNHWHHTKNEKFLVVSGRGCFRFRKYGEEKVIEYHVSGEELMVVDIPTGYVHSIVNEGEDDLVTIIWANEAFNPDKPDTYYEPV